MSRTTRQFLQDARDHAERAHGLASSLALSMFREVDEYEHAVRSYLIIVGEALRRASGELKDDHPEIPWQAIWALRNRLAHAYWRVDRDMLHRIAREAAPGLVAQLDTLLANLPETS